MTVLSLIKKIFIGASVMGMLAGMFLLIPSGQVSAATQPQTGTPPAPNTPTAVVPQASTTPQARLERLLSQEARALRAQTNRIERVDRITQRVEKLIDRLRGKGINVDGLVAALKNFQDAFDQAKHFHSAAKDILTAHAGFDDQGKVIDGQVARQTVQDAGKNLRQAHRLISQSVRHLVNTARAARNQAK